MPGGWTEIGTPTTRVETGGKWGIARAGNILYGAYDSTHVNLGVACTTGASGQNWKYCTVGGGEYNTASYDYATVGGGYQNTASGGLEATVSGGYQNTASGYGSTVGGGYTNTASGSYATVGGGDGNTASGGWATVPGGKLNTAAGYYSFAAGRQAKANHDGAFVWADNTAADFASTGVNQFFVRASGGAAIYTNAGLTAGVTLAAGAGAWVAVSDSTLKRNIRRVDGAEILSKLMEIPISRWSYKAQSANIEHIGPMAQDFYAAFGLGEDNKGISTIDPDGVALAAIQQLGREIEKLKAENDSLKAQVEEQKAINAEFEKRFEKLEKTK